MLSAFKGLFKVSEEVKRKAGLALISKAKEGDVVEVKKLLELDYIDVNSADEDGTTSLMHAALKGYLEITILLLDKGANINQKDKNGDTSLMWITPNKEMLLLFFYRGSDLNSQNTNGNTALMNAVRKNQLFVVNLLLQEGVQVNILNKYNETALSMACFDNKVELVELLLNRAAIVDDSLLGSLNKLKQQRTKSPQEIRIIQLLIQAYIAQGQHSNSVTKTLFTRYPHLKVPLSPVSPFKSTNSPAALVSPLQVVASTEAERLLSMVDTKATTPSRRPIAPPPPSVLPSPNKPTGIIPLTIESPTLSEELETPSSPSTVLLQQLQPSDELSLSDTASLQPSIEGQESATTSATTEVEAMSIHYEDLPDEMKNTVTLPLNIWDDAVTTLTDVIAPNSNYKMSDVMTDDLSMKASDDNVNMSAITPQGHKEERLQLAITDEDYFQHIQLMKSFMHQSPTLQHPSSHSHSQQLQQEMAEIKGSFLLTKYFTKCQQILNETFVTAMLIQTQHIQLRQSKLEKVFSLLSHSMSFLPFASLFCVLISMSMLHEAKKTGDFQNIYYLNPTGNIQTIGLFTEKLARRCTIQMQSWIVEVYSLSLVNLEEKERMSLKEGKQEGSTQQDILLPVSCSRHDLFPAATSPIEEVPTQPTKEDSPPSYMKTIYAQARQSIQSIKTAYQSLASQSKVYCKQSANRYSEQVSRSVFGDDYDLIEWMAIEHMTELFSYLFECSTNEMIAWKEQMIYDEDAMIEELLKSTVLKSYSCTEQSIAHEKKPIDNNEVEDLQVVDKGASTTLSLLPVSNDSCRCSITNTSSSLTSPNNQTTPMRMEEANSLHEQIHALHVSQEQSNATQDMTTQEVTSLRDKTEQIAQEARRTRDTVNAIFQTAFMPTENGQVIGVARMKDGAVVRIVNPELEERMNTTMLGQQNIQEEMISLREEVVILRDELSRMRREMIKKAL